MIWHKQATYPFGHYEVGCSAPGCKWKYTAFDKPEMESRNLIRAKWQSHREKIERTAQAQREFNKMNEASGGKVGVVMNAVVYGAMAGVAGLIIWGLVALFSGGDDSGSRDDCARYRGDVSPGSAQDGLDVEKGRNPCY